MLSVKQVEESVNTCKSNANKLRTLAGSETDQNVKKLLFEAAHHLDVSIAELEYITTSATVSV